MTWRKARLLRDPNCPPRREEPEYAGYSPHLCVWYERLLDDLISYILVIEKQLGHLYVANSGLLVSWTARGVSSEHSALPQFALSQNLAGHKIDHKTSAAFALCKEGDGTTTTICEIIMP